MNTQHNEVSKDIANFFYWYQSIGERWNGKENSQLVGMIQCMCREITKKYKCLSEMGMRY